MFLNKLNFKIQMKIFRFWRLTSKNGEIAFFNMTQSLDKIGLVQYPAEYCTM